MPSGLVLVTALVAASHAVVKAPPHTTRTELRFEGNVVLPTEVYRAVLSLPERAPADQHTADAVRDQLQAFLMRAGYVLARVETRVEDRAIRVLVDEGRVRRVVFRGRGSIKTLRFKLALNLPQNVFNLPHLQTELTRLGLRFKVPDVSFRLVPANAVAHLGPQLGPSGSDLDEVLDVLSPFVDVRENGDYDLHILFGSDERSSAVKIKSTIKAPDGLTTGAEYLGPNLVLHGDLWSAEALASVAYFDNGDHTSSPRWSRLRTGLRWMTPPPFGIELRPTVRVRADMMARQRLDLDIARYHYATFDAGLSLSRERREGMLWSLGGGYSYDRFWHIEQPPESATSTPIANKERRRPYVELVAELAFDVGEIRLDRRQELELKARLYPEGSSAWAAGWSYQQVKAVGWHDVWLRSRGELMGGAVSVPEEASVGSVALHGVFASSIYARKVAGVSTEAHLSITRDLFKLGAFVDLATFERRGVAVALRDWRLAGAVGTSFHALIASLWQLDLYYGFGISSSRQRDRALSASLKKAF